MYSDTWRVQVVHAKGFHPSLEFTPPASPSTPPHPQCGLALSLSLPPSVFPDPYQLYGLVPTLGEMVVSEEPDLEKPVSQVGNQSLSLALLHPPSRGVWTLPLHTRYQTPRELGPWTELITLPPPRVLWRCTEPLAWHTALSKDGEDRAAWSLPRPGSIMASDPSDPPSIWVYEAKEVKVHAPSLDLSIPVGDLNDASWVAWITGLLCTLGAFYILFLALLPRQSSSPSEKQAKVH
ncbi:PIG-X [Piptocephalis cylindrospora]|uniref:Protein PBN1 n=1 Tax=Piptocephalis cylindrospora TaxID=1907219 RepID=A0A4P9Y1T4_9FUNG|nr:PIG-X [Piptocephalis cylindrospora]|eukprot:RKP11790.1 PIG-X [Piptocephalis cylindrospora]